MLARRIIPCLDVKDGKVVKGTRFRNHEVIGDILPLAHRYRDEGADELVFYDITASSENRTVSADWIETTAKALDIPFCVSGGIRSVEEARIILGAGADKISINSPALENPNLIDSLAREFGSQCVVVGVDSQAQAGDYWVYQYTGNETRTRGAGIRTFDWIVEAEKRGAGEIVLNCMNQDGTREGYDIVQLKTARKRLSIPLVASGGAGRPEHFLEVFRDARVDGALAAGVFHRNEISLVDLKTYLRTQQIDVRG